MGNMEKFKLILKMRSAGSLFLTVFLLFQNTQAQSKLYVFMAGKSDSDTLKAKLAAQLTGIELFVLDRVRDFKAKVQLEPPDAILSYGPVVQDYRNYPVAISGTFKGKKYEEYFLLSEDHPVSADSLSHITVGVLDFMGKKSLTKFVHGRLKATPKLRRVTKFEDLLPLLNLKLADAILVSKRDEKLIRTASKLNLVTTEIAEAKIPLPALGIREGKAAAQLVTAIENLDAETNRQMGIEKWQK